MRRSFIGGQHTFAARLRARVADVYPPGASIVAKRSGQRTTRAMATDSPRRQRSRSEAGGSTPPVDWAQLVARPASVADGLSERLEQMIEEGVLARGSRLPAEREFAVQLGVSRASVREALRELELKGLVDRRPGRGTLVAEAGDRPVSMLARVSGDERTLREVMDLRATLEPPIAARAAGRATERDVQRLADLLARMRRERNARAFAELDVDFHRQIGRATHNELLVKLVETAMEWMQPSRAQGLMSAARRRASVTAHAAILEAIAAGDSAAAATAMTLHLEDVDRLVEEAGPRG
jgi:GntR family transcriptional repressor for pyruvate dehydrogenase complex